ncbi:N-acetyltransferase [Paucibacter sp. APW11]|uniref:N-acetyltransferase n=1 Tax=Roseateles aquae TaxID=3077235 RepID=A0ABU3PGH5_9BURK|nr:N-acetyltransferase [Paucibacter sp. APW11]MDT9001608.1 N-acetyltransferase [Paucibacter sp. APW11]
MSSTAAPDGLASGTLPLDPALQALARRAEAAGLNATAPPQLADIEGWQIRLSPGQAKRSRCVNALAEGRLPLPELLQRCAQSFAAAGLPLVVRLTPFSQPADLDERLAALGWPAFDAADVMVLASLDSFDSVAMPGGQVLHAAEAEDYAAIAGALRGASDSEIAAHAERLRASPVPYQGFLLHRNTIRGWELLACGQIAREGHIVGLYDINTPPAFRGQGHATTLCRALLAQAHLEGAQEAYLQVGVNNEPALRLYRRLGFQTAYRYHYRSPTPELA